jgi:cob(I)alamin adenosyltransferase
LWFGRQLCVSKASNIIKAFGALETALSYINNAAIGCKRQKKCLTRAYRALFNLGFYLSTGQDSYYGTSLHLMRRALKCLYPLLADTPLGWVICHDRCCALINTARVWVRWAERRLAAVEEGREVILLLNHLGNLLFELMRTNKHGVKTQDKYIVASPRPLNPSIPSWWHEKI